MPAEAPPWLRASKDGVEVLVHVQPGARRSGVVGVHGDALKVSVKAPPSGGKANEAVIEIVASALGVKRGRVELISGATARSKRLLVSGFRAEDAVLRIAELLG